MAVVMRPRRRRGHCRVRRVCPRGRHRWRPSRRRHQAGHADHRRNRLRRGHGDHPLRRRSLRLGCRCAVCRYRRHEESRLSDVSAPPVALGSEMRPGLMITGHALARYAQRVLRIVPEAWSNDEVLDVLSAGDIRRIRAVIEDICSDAAAAASPRSRRRRRDARPEDPQVAASEPVLLDLGDRGLGRAAAPGSRRPGCRTGARRDPPRA